MKGVAAQKKKLKKEKGWPAATLLGVAYEPFTFLFFIFFV
jgi:hypothetical protein